LSKQVIVENQFLEGEEDDDEEKSEQKMQ